MKQTVRTANYDATIDIPYEKLASKANFTRLPQQQSGGCDCCQKITVMGCCPPRDTGLNPKILEQLQSAYDADMAGKQKQIAAAKMENERLSQQISQFEKESEQQQSLYEAGRRNSESEASAMKAKIEGLQEALKASKIERQKILKQKIADFQNRLMKEAYEHDRERDMLRQELNQIYGERQKESQLKLQSAERLIFEKDTEIINLKRTIDQFALRVNGLNDEIKALQSVNKQKTEAISRVTAGHDAERQKGMGLQYRLNELERQNSGLRGNLTVLQQMVDKLNLSNGQNQADKLRYQLRLETAERDLRECQRDKQKLGLECNELNSLRKEWEKDIKDRQRLIRSIENLEFQIDQFKAGYTENGAVDVRISKIRAELDSSYRENERRILDECSVHDQSMKDQERSISELNMQVNKLSAQNEDVRGQLAEAERRIQQLDNSVCNWKCRYLTAERDLTDLQKERADLTAQSRIDIARIESLTTNVANLTQDKTILLGQVSSLEKEIDRLSRQVYQLRNQLKSLHLKLAEKEELLNSRQSCSHDVNIECHKYIRSLENQIQHSRGSIDKNNNTERLNFSQERHHNPHHQPIVQHGMTGALLNGQLGDFYKREFEQRDGIQESGHPQRPM